MASEVITIESDTSDYDSDSSESSMEDCSNNNMDNPQGALSSASVSDDDARNFKNTKDTSLAQTGQSDSDSDSVESSNVSIPDIGSSRTRYLGVGKKNVSSTINSMSAYVVADAGQHNGHASTAGKKAEMDAYRTAPIFTSEVSNYLELNSSPGQSGSTSFTQFGLIGSRNPPEANNSILANKEQLKSDTDLVIANMDTPWSAFICGSQGAGKSHTLSCLLENGLLGGGRIGLLPNPLAATVFHYDNYTSASSGQLCEAAYLCSSGIPVTILVSPSNIWAMTELYTKLPGVPHNAPKPKVLPLYLSEKFLNISTMLKLMAVDHTSDTIPLYMETVMSILREMAMEGKGTDSFSYSEFRSRLDQVQWAQGQQGPLKLRLQLLDSFLAPSQFTTTTRPAQAKEDIWAFEPGTLTIIDLSDQFVSSSDACSLFSICLSIFMGHARSGKIVALDEAHKFLLQTGAARNLTEDLTSVIRQQRHTGTRVLIATQEPTLSPDLIDLSNATFVHRFSSPAWYGVLGKHLAGAQKYDSRKGDYSLFDTIVALETGEALLFCSTALVSVDMTSASEGSIRKLGNQYLKVKVRKRLTADGGKSILASDTGVLLVNSTAQIPMHVVSKLPPTGPSKGKPGSIRFFGQGPEFASFSFASSAGVSSVTSRSQTASLAATARSNNQTASTNLENQIKLEANSLFQNRVGDPFWQELDNDKLNRIINKLVRQVNITKPAILKNQKLLNVIKQEHARVIGR